jgi:hypothetical protein
MKPQTLGAIIKRTGILKSQQRKGNMYNYSTEGYTLTRQYDGRYIFDYYGRLELARRTESQEHALNERRREAVHKVLTVLGERGIPTLLDGMTIYITLPTETGE